MEVRASVREARRSRSLGEVGGLAVGYFPASLWGAQCWACPGVDRDSQLSPAAAKARAILRGGGSFMAWSPMLGMLPKYPPTLINNDWQARIFPFFQEKYLSASRLKGVTGPPEEISLGLHEERDWGLSSEWKPRDEAEWTQIDSQRIEQKELNFLLLQMATELHHRGFCGLFVWFLTLDPVHILHSLG